MYKVRLTITRLSYQEAWTRCTISVGLRRTDGGQWTNETIVPQRTQPSLGYQITRSSAKLPGIAQLQSGSKVKNREKVPAKPVGNFARCKCVLCLSSRWLWHTGCGWYSVSLKYACSLGEGGMKKRKGKKEERTCQKCGDPMKSIIKCTRDDYSDDRPAYFTIINLGTLTVTYR